MRSRGLSNCQISGELKVEVEEEGETTLHATGRHYQGTVNDGMSTNCHQTEQNTQHPEEGGSLGVY